MKLVTKKIKQLEHRVLSPILADVVYNIRRHVSDTMSWHTVDQVLGIRILISPASRNYSLHWWQDKDYD